MFCFKAKTNMSTFSLILDLKVFFEKEREPILFCLGYYGRGFG